MLFEDNQDVTMMRAECVACLHGDQMICEGGFIAVACVQGRDSGRAPERLVAGRRVEALHKAIEQDA